MVRWFANKFASIRLSESCPHEFDMKICVQHTMTYVHPSNGASHSISYPKITSHKHTMCARIRVCKNGKHRILACAQRYDSLPHVVDVVIVDCVYCVYYIVFAMFAPSASPTNCTDIVERKRCCVEAASEASQTAGVDGVHWHSWHARIHSDPMKMITTFKYCMRVEPCLRHICWQYSLRLFRSRLQPSLVWHISSDEYSTRVRLPSILCVCIHTSAGRERGRERELVDLHPHPTHRTAAWRSSFVQMNIMAAAAAVAASTIWRCVRP